MLDETPHGLKECMENVAEFHRKHRFPIREGFKEKNVKTSEAICDVADQLADVSNTMLQEYVVHKDQRALRIHLITEETAELIDAMDNNDRTATLDALADLIYVVVGTAVTLGLPLPEAFREVHRSNMTKEPRVEGNPRCRVKGASYQPADIARVLRDYDSLWEGLQ